LPSAAIILIGIGGFHPVARSFEMSAFSSGRTSLPPVSRSATTGGASGFDQVSTSYIADGDSCIVCVPSSGVSDTRPFPSRPIR
jgi:hypothetical protein